MCFNIIEKGSTYKTYIDLRGFQMVEQLTEVFKPTKEVPAYKREKCRGCGITHDLDLLDNGLCLSCEVKALKGAM